MPLYHGPKPQSKDWKNVDPMLESGSKTFRCRVHFCSLFEAKTNWVLVPLQDDSDGFPSCGKHFDRELEKTMSQIERL
jgi:hypothetical protein